MLFHSLCLNNVTLLVLYKAAMPHKVGLPSIDIMLLNKDKTVRHFQEVQMADEKWEGAGLSAK